MRAIIILAIAPMLGGCVFAVRHVAMAANRSDAEQRLRDQFPIGTPEESIRAALAGKGYVCTDQMPADPHHFLLDCALLNPRRTAGTTLFGGNWRLSFSGSDGHLEKLKASSPRRRLGA